MTNDLTAKPFNSQLPPVALPAGSIRHLRDLIAYRVERAMRLDSLLSAHDPDGPLPQELRLELCVLAREFVLVGGVIGFTAGGVGLSEVGGSKAVLHEAKALQDRIGELSATVAAQETILPGAEAEQLAGSLAGISLVVGIEHNHLKARLDQAGGVSDGPPASAA